MAFAVTHGRRPARNTTTPMQSYDAIVIGAGHNGLTAAAYLARAGKSVLVVERRPILGGIAATEEVCPGYRFSTGAHLAGSFAEEIIRDLKLRQYGLEMLPLEPPLFAPLRAERGLLLSRHPPEAESEIRRFSKKDAASFDAFCRLAGKLAQLLRALYGVALPDHAAADGLPIAELIKTGWKYIRLPEKEKYEFLRVLPMSIGDWLDEWFETDLLKAALGAAGILGSFVGPRQQGTAYLFLHHQLGRSNGGLRTAGFVRGGIGNLGQALAGAALGAGAEIRVEAEVVRIVVKNGTAAGILLQNGDELAARTVVCGADVKTTFLRLVEPTYLDPHFLLGVKNIRSRGTVAKVNLAVDRLPDFGGAASEKELGGVISIGPTPEYLERASDDAKYGRFSKKPFLEIVIPSVVDPSLAPPGKHVMSVWMQYAPYDLREESWNEQREALGDAVVALIEDYAPGFRNSILHRQVLTPADLERVFGTSGGHPYHAELALDQIFFMRPLPGWARYGTPIKNLYLCGSGSHPGGGITGLPGYYAAKTLLAT